MEKNVSVEREEKFIFTRKVILKDIRCVLIIIMLYIIASEVGAKKVEKNMKRVNYIHI